MILKICTPSQAETVATSTGGISRINVGAFSLALCDALATKVGLGGLVHVCRATAAPQTRTAIGLPLESDVIRHVYIIWSCVKPP